MNAMSSSQPGKSAADALTDVLRLGAYTLLDRVRKRRPTDINSIPHSAQAITVEWLTAALCALAPGARIESFERGRASRGSTSREAFQVHYNEAGRRAGLPEFLFAKMTPHFTSRLVCTLSGATRSELGFYTKLRKELDIEAPYAYYSDCSERSGRSVFLFRDIAHEGAQFLDPNAKIKQSEAEDMVGLLASLHGRYWGSRKLDSEFTWLRTSAEFQADTARLIGFQRRSLIGLVRAERVIPRDLLQRRDRIWPAVLKSLDLNSQAPHTYLHHDVHIGNWYRTADGRMGLTDWQLNVKGQWASDIAYALSSALDVEARRAWEVDLIRLYLEKLAATGTVAPSFDEAWLQYRQQQFHGFAFWLYTIGYGLLQPRMQPDEYSFTNLERMANAIVDLGSLDAVLSEH
jgi:hypothetical protein